LTTFTALDRESLFYGWVSVLVAGAAVMVLGLVASGYTVDHPVATLLLALGALAAERESIRLSPTLEVSVASIVYIFAAVVCGPVSAVLVGGVGLLADLPRRDGERPFLRWLTWTASRIITSGAVGIGAAAVVVATADGFWGLVAAVAVAFGIENGLELALTPVAPAIRGRSSWSDTVRSVAPALFGSLPIQAPVVAVLAYSYRTISPWSVVLFAIPGVAAHRLLMLYRQQRDTAEALGSANERLSNANLSFATALVATLDARDRYTAGHSAAVAIYARDIATRMDLSERERELVHLCGLVHDVGKIGLPAGLLEKPGALTLDERRQMETHSTIGERILRNVDDYAEIAGVVRSHHERVDGNGYPDKLCKDEIPLLARIIAVADAYNAMTSDRPYRDAMPSRVARLRLAQAVESQFDTSVVAAFEAILTAATEAYRMATAPEFELAYDVTERVEPQPATLDDDLRGVAIAAALAT
jgi:putative nucleotidyltransferase with HDIG domain